MARSSRTGTRLKDRFRLICRLNFNETANTLGQTLYAKQEPRKFDRSFTPPSDPSSSPANAQQERTG